MATTPNVFVVRADTTQFERDLQQLRRRAQRLLVPRWCRHRSARLLVLASATAFPISQLVQVLR